MLDRPLASLWSIRTPFLKLVFAVGRELRLVNGELPLGETESSLVGRQIGEEELEEAWIAKLRRRTGRSIEPGAQRGHTRRHDRENAPASAFALTRLGDQAEGRQTWWLAVQEGVRERPEVPERGPHVLLEVVRCRWALAGEESENQI